MATSQVRGVRVALEALFASVDSATGIPSTSGLTWYTLECDAVDVTTVGDPVLADRADVRSDYYGLPPEPETMWSGGSRVRRRVGSIKLTCPLRGMGDGFVYATVPSLPLHMLLASGMASHSPGAVFDTVSAQVTTTRWTPAGALADIDPGIGLAWDRNGRREYSFVTDNPGDIYNSPAFSSAPAAAQVIRLCETLYSRAGMTVGPSVALELTGDGWRTYAFGGRMESVTITCPPRKAMLEITIRFAHATDDHASGIRSVNPTRSTGAVAHALGSYVVLSQTAIGSTVPAQLARSVMQVDEWTFTLTNTLTPVGHSNDITGMADMEVTGATAAVRMVATVSTTVADDILTQTERSLLLGLGPVGAGNGAAFYLPAAVLQNDASKRELGADRVRMELQYSNGLWALDAVDGNPTAYPAGAPGNSSVRIALPY